MNISIWMLLVGLLILIWDRAASLDVWSGDMKVRAFSYHVVIESRIDLILNLTQIAFVATLATVFALSNYVIGSVFIWRLNSELYKKSGP
jgi:hypothetical protein